MIWVLAIVVFFGGVWLAETGHESGPVVLMLGLLAAIFGLSWQFTKDPRRSK